MMNMESSKVVFQELLRFGQWWKVSWRNRVLQDPRTIGELF